MSRPLTEDERKKFKLKFGKEPDERTACNEAGDRYTVLPLACLPGPARELVESGGHTIATMPFTVAPLTRQELQHEQASLLREQRLITDRLARIETLLAA